MEELLGNAFLICPADRVSRDKSAGENEQMCNSCVREYLEYNYSRDC